MYEGELVMDTKLCSASVWLWLLLVLTAGWKLAKAQQQQRREYNCIICVSVYIEQTRVGPSLVS